MTKIQISKLLLVLLVVVAVVGIAHAQTAIQTELAAEPVSNIGQYLAAVVKWSARLGVVSAVLVIVWAGNVMITSGGSPEGITQAKELIQGALVGLITIFLIGALLAWLVDTSQFSSSATLNTNSPSAIDEESD